MNVSQRVLKLKIVFPRANKFNGLLSGISVWWGFMAMWERKKKDPFPLMYSVTYTLASLSYFKLFFRVCVIDVFARLRSTSIQHQLANGELAKGLGNRDKFKHWHQVTFCIFLKCKNRIITEYETVTQRRPMT